MAGALNVLKGVLIDSVLRKVVEVTVPKGLEAIYKAIKCRNFACPMTWKGGDTLYVDDEGAINGTRVGFRLGDIDYFGSGLILGSDSEGESADVLRTPLDFKVTFLPKRR